MLAGEICRAAVLTAAALCAGVSVKNLFPGEFFELAHTERFRVFKITDGFLIACGF